MEQQQNKAWVLGKPALIIHTDSSIHISVVAERCAARYLDMKTGDIAFVCVNESNNVRRVEKTEHGYYVIGMCPDEVRRFYPSWSF